MADFQGTNIIVVQPGDSKVPYRFTFTACSTATANDGGLPFDSEISSYAVTAHKHDAADADATSDLIHSHAREGLIITVNLQYPSTNGVGTYHLRFVLTLATGNVIEYDFNRVFVKDL